MESGEVAPSALNADEMRAALDPALIGRKILVLGETRSTNDFVFELARDPDAEGTVVFAETQTAGRGQYGKQWASAARLGLWFSILLRPRIDLAQSARLTTWLAEGIASVIQHELNLPAHVKPPNDVYVGARKVCGVLVEMRAVKGEPHAAIAGVGINANQRAEDFPPELREHAASLAQLTGAAVNRQQLAVALLRDLDRTYAMWFG